MTFSPSNLFDWFPYHCKQLSDDVYLAEVFSGCLLLLWNSVQYLIDKESLIISEYRVSTRKKQQLFSSDEDLKTRSST